TLPVLFGGEVAKGVELAVGEPHPGRRPPGGSRRVASGSSNSHIASRSWSRGVLRRLVLGESALARRARRVEVEAQEGRAAASVGCGWSVEIQLEQDRRVGRNLPPIRFPETARP